MTHKDKLFPIPPALSAGTIIILVVLSAILPLMVYTKDLKNVSITSANTSNMGSSTIYSNTTSTNATTPAFLQLSSLDLMFWTQIAHLSGPSAPEDESELNSARGAINSLLLRHSLHTLSPRDHPVVEYKPPPVYECDKLNYWTRYADAVSAMSRLMLKKDYVCLGNWIGQECTEYVTWGTARIEMCSWHTNNHWLSCGEVAGYAFEVVEACKEYRGAEDWGYTAGWRVFHTSPKGHKSKVYVH